MIKQLFLIAGILLLFLRWAGVISIFILWPVLCIVAWMYFTYLSIHNKNKLRETPRPVYLAK